MCQPENSAVLPQATRQPVFADALPQEVMETLDAAECLCTAINEHAADMSLPREVEQEWKRLGECLAWLRR